jgi:uncharacterized protein
MRPIALTTGFLIALIVQLGFAYSKPLEIPFLSGPVIDQAQVLSTSDEAQLADQIRGLKNSIQFQIWTIPSLQGESIEGLSIRAADQWKLGTTSKDNGVLIVLALEDRQVRIEVGQGLEGDIPDVLAGRIIDGWMTPSFRAGNYLEGFQNAIRNIQLIASGQNLPTKPHRKGVPSQLLFNALFIVLMLGLFVIRLIFPTRFRAHSNRRYGSWGGSGGFGGFGGGGGWSGGGGGFSGGGATGRW